jgi:GH24 family phage-related lysozyme (muramidase)
MNIDKLCASILKHEGSNKDKDGMHVPYKDTAGLWTIGYGHMVTKDEMESFDPNRKYTEDEAIEIFKQDVNIAIDGARVFIDEHSIPEEVFLVIVELCFWMGLPRLLGFKKARKALEEKDFVTCSQELLDSKLGRSKVKGIVKRITELSNRMRDV